MGQYKALHVLLNNVLGELAHILKGCNGTFSFTFPTLVPAFNKEFNLLNIN